MNKLRTISIVFSMLALIGLNSCDEDDIESPGKAIVGPGTVHTRIDKSGSLTSLEAALNTATGDLTTTLEGTGPFTVFAPNNTAFTTLAESLGYEATEDISAADAFLANVDPAILSQILTYHIVSGKMDTGSLSDGTTLTTVLGDELSVIVAENGDIQLLDATKEPQTNPVSTLIQQNGYADNGIVHYIDKVLLPQAAIDALNFDTRPNLLEWIAGTDDLSLLESAMEKAGLTDTFAKLDTAIALAPNNQAFVDLLNTLGNDYNSIDDFDNEVEIALLGNILLYHVLPPVNGSTDLIVGPATTLLEDNFVNVTSSGGFVFGDATAVTANTVTADIDAKNGYVNIIDKVLLPQEVLDFVALLGSDDLATNIAGSPQLSVFEEALIATDLVGKFTDITNTQDSDATNYTYYRPATVFAPTNAAFDVLFGYLGSDYTSIASFDTEEELDLLRNLLLYHVLDGNIVSGDLEAGMATTASGKDIEIISVVGTDNFVIGDASDDINANVTTPDVLARNGVTHVIDKVLLPKSVLDFIESMD